MPLSSPHLSGTTTAGAGRAVRRRLIVLLAAGVLVLGIGESMAGSYLVLYGAQWAHLSPFAIGALVSLVALSGIAVNTWLGHRYDRAPSRRPALLAVCASAIGSALLPRYGFTGLFLASAAGFLLVGLPLLVLVTFAWAAGPVA
ncbi:hypothetical protein AB0M46_47355 [Dactylosporangium sp. NPDC051485]|uniref:hypothetical protein n=1 Tax=Dactylosporangium sp. NPDC051485 TaxID=3154846 RepID=UPI003431AFB8